MSRLPAHHRSTTRASIHPTPLWRMRLWQQLPRLLLHAAAMAGLLASIRFALAPPRLAPVRNQTAAKPVDLQAQWFASLFTRTYLSWQQGDLEARRQTLEQLTGSALSLEAGMQPPRSGSQQVTFEQIVQEREPQPYLHVYAIAAYTVPQGVLYLTVPVLHKPGNPVSLAGYPSFVGPPAARSAQPVLEAGPEVQDSSLRTVVQRALGNYLARAATDLAADLAPGASISPPQQGLALEALQSLTWASGQQDTVVAQIVALGPGGARYTLAYEVKVFDVAGRWEVAAIQMQANA